MNKEYKQMMEEAEKMLAEGKKMLDDYLPGDAFQKQHNQDLYIFSFSRLTWRRRWAIFWKLTTTALGVLVFGDGQLKLRRK
jgi:hypothetical protein